MNKEVLMNKDERIWCISFDKTVLGEKYLI